MVCRYFILPEGCKPCLFLFAQLIVPYRTVGRGGNPKTRRFDEVCHFNATKRSRATIVVQQLQGF